MRSVASFQAIWEQTHKYITITVICFTKGRVNNHNLKIIIIIIIFFFFYDAGAIVYSSSEYSDGDGPILYSYVSCYGPEDGLADCGKQGYDDISSCLRTRLTGLLCRDGNKSKLIGNTNN